jgi:hypothetical protein
MGKDSKPKDKGKGKQAAGSSGGDDAGGGGKGGKGKGGKSADGLGTCTYVKGISSSLGRITSNLFSDSIVIGKIGLDWRDIGLGSWCAGGGTGCP